MDLRDIRQSTRTLSVQLTGKGGQVWSSKDRIALLLMYEVRKERHLSFEFWD